MQEDQAYKFKFTGSCKLGRSKARCLNFWLLLTLWNHLMFSVQGLTTAHRSSDDQYLYGRGGDMSAGVMTAKAVAVPEIPKGEQKVTASVSVTYEIR